MRKRLAACRAAILISGAAVIAACGNTPAAPAAPAHTAALSVAGQHEATLALVSGATTVTVSAAAMPGKLVRVWTPANSGVRPQLLVSAGRVQTFLARTGLSGPSALSIQLSTAVTWQLQFGAGSGQTIVNLSDSKIASIDFTAGANLIQLTLPRPSGTCLITLAGGASQVNLIVPAGVPTRLRLYGGASTATLDGVTHAGIRRGTVFSSAGWAQATNRYDVAAPAGVSDISVTG